MRWFQGEQFIPFTENLQHQPRGGHTLLSSPNHDGFASYPVGHSPRGFTGGFVVALHSGCVTNEVERMSRVYAVRQRVCANVRQRVISPQLGELQVHGLRTHVIVDGFSVLAHSDIYVCRHVYYMTGNGHRRLKGVSGHERAFGFKRRFDQMNVQMQHTGMRHILGNVVFQCLCDGNGFSLGVALAVPVVPSSDGHIAGGI